VRACRDGAAEGHKGEIRVREEVLCEVFDVSEANATTNKIHSIHSWREGERSEDRDSEKSREIFEAKLVQRSSIKNESARIQDPRAI